jgi:hypothetical protein
MTPLARSKREFGEPAEKELTHTAIRKGSGSRADGANLAVAACRRLFVRAPAELAAASEREYLNDGSDREAAERYYADVDTDSDPAALLSGRFRAVGGEGAGRSGDALLPDPLPEGAAGKQR